MVVEDILVGVPTVGVPRVELDEPDAFLQHPASKEAACAELRGYFVIKAVEFAGRTGLPGNIDDIGRSGLHPECKFIGSDT